MLAFEWSTALAERGGDVLYESQALRLGALPGLPLPARECPYRQLPKLNVAPQKIILLVHVLRVRLRRYGRRLRGSFSD